MNRVDELKERFIDMLDQGCTRFGFTTGVNWMHLSIEEKADAILKMWDAPAVSEGPPRTNKPARLVADVVAEIQREAYKACS